MQDFLKRLLIAGLMALFVSLLFLGGKHSQAEILDIQQRTSHWVWPADGVVTDLFGTRKGNHKGIDIAANLKTPIHTVDKGVVTKSYYSSTYGHVIFIKHENKLETVYAHLNKRFVEEGEAVEQGEIIGEMGNTGDSSGVHLHFEVHEQQWTYKKENAMDPGSMLGLSKIGQPVVALGKQAVGSVEAFAKQPFVEAEAETRPNVINDKVSHTVMSGETLWSVAQKYKTSVKEIQEMNELEGSAITVGQQLWIEIQNKKKYVVSAGDTLYSISQKTSTPVNVLIELNELTSDVIKPQQILHTE